MANITGVEGIITELRAEKINLTNQLRQVDAALSALVGLNGGRAVAPASSRRGTRLSAAARRKISIAQKARWAKIKAAKK